MDDVAKRLTKEWKSRHLESSEEAFAMADEGITRESKPSFFKISEQPSTVLAATKSK
jgi:hypothetical protein|tara:strand:- start:688 stop:858 length:171 start_codon:yes stop_codon:yes gene_type:complete